MTNGISAIQSGLVSKNVITTNTTQNGGISYYQQELEKAEQEKDKASKALIQNEKCIKQLEKEVKEIKMQINEKIAEAVNEGEALSSQQQSNVNNAIDQTIQKYLNGEITKDELMETLQASLATSESEIASKLENLMNGGDSLVNELEGMMADLCNLYSENEALKETIKKADKKIKESTEAIAAEQAKDPIGFEKDNITYDFIIDRDNDGQFDGSNEFLGAENGFEEMKAYDKDGNGFIEGEELNNMQMIKTDKNTGKQSFVSAQEAGVSKIDLSSYEKTGYTQTNGNQHLGSFNIDAQGETIEGYQTLDKVDWLDANYGNSYGKSINGDKEIQTNQQSNINNLSTIFYNKIVSNENSNERKLVKNTKEEISSLMNDTINTNTQLMVNAQNNALNKESKEDENGKQTQNYKKQTTASFMAMAYSYNAEQLKKKQEVA